MGQQDCRSRSEQQEQTQPNRAKDGPVHVLSPLVLKPVMMPVTAAIMMPRILPSVPTGPGRMTVAVSIAITVIGRPDMSRVSIATVGVVTVPMPAIALSYAVLLLFACLLEGLRQQMIENGTHFGLAHIQVHAPDYYPDRSIYKTLGGPEGTDVSGLLTAITSDPRVRAASPRVYGYGLVSHAHHSAGAELLGIVPDQEQQISALHEGTMRRALKICCSLPG